MHMIILAKKMAQNQKMDFRQKKGQGAFEDQKSLENLKVQTLMINFLIRNVSWEALSSL